MSSTAASPVVMLLTTLGAEADAAAFARTLVDERLAACVNILPVMRSVYRWNGAREEAGEQQVIIKTTAGLVPAIEARFRSLHPYELPEFIVLEPGHASTLYQDWVRESVG